MTTRRTFLLALAAAVPLTAFAAALPAVSQEKSAAATRRVESLTIGGVKRSYILRLPPGYDAKTPLPLVVMLHGRGGSGQIAERAYGWPEKAAKEGFITAFPDALPDRMGKPAWNAGYNAGQRSSDDVGFLRELIGTLKKTYAVDGKRVYVCGHSSGGMMSYRLGAEMAGDLAAIGVCAGTIGSTARGGEKTVIPTPKAPLSVLHVHGKADEVVPYDSGRNGGKPGAVFDFIPAPESAAFWAKANGCSPATPKRAESFGGNVVRETYGGGRAGTEVVLISIGDGGHMWPGMGGRRRTAAGGAANRQMNATDEMWLFFKAHPRP